MNCSKKVWRDPAYFIAFGFGAGLAPVAPGTCGTLLAIPLYLMMSQVSAMIYLLLLVLSFILGVWACDRVTRDIGVHDFAGIVWDEVVGYWLTMVFVPPTWLTVLLGFALFRLFDIWKPYPIGYIDQQVRGGLGIMLDDVLAAIAASIVLHVLLWGLLG